MRLEFSDSANFIHRSTTIHSLSLWAKPSTCRIVMSVCVCAGCCSVESPQRGRQRVRVDIVRGLLKEKWSVGSVCVLLLAVDAYALLVASKQEFGGTV